MIIKIDALDTLFFRDGKPFAMDEDTWANSIFPPSPSVIYGALRSTYFSHHIDKLECANKDNDPTKNLIIKGIYILTDGAIHLPLPNDCVRKKKETKNDKDVVSILTMSELNELKDIKIKCSCPTQYALTSNEIIEGIDNGLINIYSLKEYLKCTNAVLYSILEKNRILSEPKIGIGINKKTGTSEDGKLYRVDMKRLENKKGEKLSIIVDFEGLDDLPKMGMMKLGGEGKAISYEQFKSIDFSFENFNLNGNKFKLYLSTPAIFKNGWLPAWIDENTLIGEYKGIKLKLLTASIGKIIHIGGFDMKAKKPKPMYKAIPQGSVYYFEIIEGDIQTVFKTFNNYAISDIYLEQGFGIAFVGGIKDV